MYMMKAHVGEISNETLMRKSATQPQFKSILNANIYNVAAAPSQKKAEARRSPVRKVKTRRSEWGSFKNVVPTKAPVEYVCNIFTPEKRSKITPTILQSLRQSVYNPDGSIDLDLNSSTAQPLFSARIPATYCAQLFKLMSTGTIFGIRSDSEPFKIYLRSLSIL